MTDREAEPRPETAGQPTEAAGGLPGLPPVPEMRRTLASTPHNRLLIAAVFVALQVAFFIGWAATEDRRLAEGIAINVKPQPYDPRDILRGQFMQLAYDFSGLEPVEDQDRRLVDPGSMRRPGEPPEQAEVWAVLAPAEGDLHQAVYTTYERPQHLNRGEVAIRGVRTGWRNQFGIEKYFVEEGTPTPDLEDLTVRLRVGEDGAARIEDVLLDGQSWP